MVKPSELAPASSALLAAAIPNYVDSEAVKIIEGGIDVSSQLLQYKWDKIFFTGPTSTPTTYVYFQRSIEQSLFISNKGKIVHI